MEININKAINLFFPKTSLEMVYIEAVANAIDAGADSIKINIELDSFDKGETLKISIEDNGKGFDDINFNKFSRLLETEQQDHKGTGRLVFLHYFGKVAVESFYGKKLRKFNFTKNFNGHSDSIQTNEPLQKTILTFTEYTKQLIHSHNYIRPSEIKKCLLNKFYPLFYSLKKREEKLNIEIRITQQENDILFENESLVVNLNIKDLPMLKSLEIIDTDSIFDKFELLYIVRSQNVDNLIITAICADDRVIVDNIIQNKNIPLGYEVIFLLFSNSFLQGKSDTSRTTFDIDDKLLRSLKKVLRNKISEILNDEIPNIKERNLKIHENLIQRYPHLQGYFHPKTVGLVDKNEILDEAQQHFFQDQKRILDADKMTDEEYKKSLEISSRLLTEYILYRNIIINKLKETDTKNSEAGIHNIIVPMRNIYEKSTFIDDIYLNNAWLLDDKYMSYSTILSDMEMGKLLDKISIDDYQKDDSRPDISIVFSKEPSEEAKADVVIVELKKLGLDLKRKNDIDVQLRQRARKLLQYYPNKIQRIWFYGIIDIDDEFRLLLRDEGYTPLFSNGSLFCREAKIYLDDNNFILTTLYIQSFDAFIKDAESRNATFLQILKEGLKNK